MAITSKQARKALDIEPTPTDKGLTMTLKVTAWDNGLVTVNRVPVRAGYDLGRALLMATEHATAQLMRFYQEVEARRASKAAL